MKTCLLRIGFVVGLQLATLQWAMAAPAHIRVRLQKEKVSYLLQGSQLSWAEGEDEGFWSSLWKWSVGPSWWVPAPHEDLWQISAEPVKGPTVWKVTDLRSHEDKLIVSPSLIIEGRGLRVSGQALGGKAIFIARGDEDSEGKRKLPTIDLITEVGFEDYLQGVLAAEMPLSWPVEALKAQAVVIRSYTLARLREGVGSEFHFEASVVDQMYRPEQDRGLSHKIKRVFREAREYALRAEDGDVLMSFYHADCGGQTEESESVWPNAQPTDTVQDRACPLSPQGRWKVQMGRSHLAGRLKKYFGLSSKTQFLDLKVVERTDSGRVSRAAVMFDQETRWLSGNELRAALGFKSLKSTLFQLESASGHFDFKGTGYGHGVGLCQWGSKVMAEKGFSYRQILRHYFPSARIDLGDELIVKR